MKAQGFLLIFSLLTLQLAAQSPNGIIDKDVAYTQTITNRSNKIVAKLGIIDSAKFYQVQNVLVSQYRQLNTLHDSFKTRIKAIKTDSLLDKAKSAELLVALENEKKAALDLQHKLFINQLATDLTEAQIGQVKDEMTYNKVSVTYNAYVSMIPALTKEQKQKVYDFLIEAREIAMDAESAEKKTEWFGKYKGKINNYLSAQGYNVKKEGEEWEKRIKEAKAKENKAS